MSKLRPQRINLAMKYWNIRRNQQDLHLHGVNLNQLIKEYPTPMHVLDEERLADNIKACLTLKDPQDWPVELFFSYKTTPVPGILNIIHAHGAKAEVISEYELWLATRLGIEPNNIIYNGPAKSDASLDYAIEIGILSININHAEEMLRIQNAARRVKKRANVSIRVVLPACWSGQFGFPINREATLKAFQEAKAAPELNLVGIHCHRGHLIDDIETWQHNCRQLLDYCEFLADKVSFIPQLIDFGGSIGIPTTRYLSEAEQRLSRSFVLEPVPPDPERMPSLALLSGVVRQETQEFFTKRGWPRPRIAVEFGRAITGNAQMLLTRLITSKETEAPFTYGVLDVGINIASIVTSEFHQIFPLRETESQDSDFVSYRFTGPICHLGDVLYSAWRLPRLRDGDGLAIMDSGAYFISAANSFSFPQPGVLAINKDGQVRVLRRSESFLDLIALDELS